MQVTLGQFTLCVLERQNQCVGAMWRGAVLLHNYSDDNVTQAYLCMWQSEQSLNSPVHLLAEQRLERVYSLRCLHDREGSK